jgi:hypothetical protein
MNGGGEGEGGGIAGHDDIAAMGRDDVPHDAEADAGALGLPAQLVADAVEALEDSLALALRDARAVVRDGEKPMAAV